MCYFLLLPLGLRSKININERSSLMSAVTMSNLISTAGDFYDLMGDVVAIIIANPILCLPIFFGVAGFGVGLAKRIIGQ